MIVRIFTFAVKREDRAKLLKFVKRDGGWNLLRRIPHLRDAYLLHSLDHGAQYLWITIWTSSSGLKKAMKSPAWKRLYVREASSGVIFGGHYQREHYDGLLRYTYKPP